MPRNVERDAIQEQKRRERLLASGFKLFSEKGIENVTLQSVADDAGVGIATLYNYYQNKVNLVTAISANMWNAVWMKTVDEIGDDFLKKYTAYECVEYYLNLIIRVYKENAAVLRFSGNYKTFISIVAAQDTQIKQHLDIVNPLGEYLHKVYEKAKEDKSIRSDIPEDKFVTTIALTMLGTAERYAQGIIWTKHENNDYSKELEILKDMMLSWLKG